MKLWLIGLGLLIWLAAFVSSKWSGQRAVRFWLGSLGLMIFSDRRLDRAARASLGAGLGPGSRGRWDPQRLLHRYAGRAAVEHPGTDGVEHLGRGL